MDLKDFVSETLLSIITGVSDAQGKAKGHGALVNPAGLMRHTAKIADNAIWDNRTNVYAQPISFDIAITVGDTASSGGKIKVLAGILGGSVGGEEGSKNAVASRVQFVVPVLLPSQNVEDPMARAPGAIRKTISKGQQP